MADQAAGTFQATEVDAQALLEKLQALAETLTPGERAVFGQLMARAEAAGGDTAGYGYGAPWWEWFFQPFRIISNDGGSVRPRY